MVKKMLHVGCGPQRKQGTTPGFAHGDWEEVRLDIDASVEPDVIGTMTDMAAVECGSIDALFSSHNIEHLYPHEVPVALQEFHRVLQDDGYAVITCPDLQSVCALVAAGNLDEPAYTVPAGPISPIDILYGWRASMEKGNLYMAHRTGFTEKTLMKSLEDAGFKTVGVLCRPEHYDLWAIAFKQEKSEGEIRKIAALHFPS